MPGEPSDDPSDCAVVQHRCNGPAIALVLLAIIVLGFIQGYLDWPHKLRTSSPALNHWVTAAASFMVPVLAFLGSRALQGVARSALAWSSILLLALPSLLIGACSVVTAPAFFSVDKEFERISEQESGLVAYRLYRTNCGATCSFGLVLRKEIDVGPGLTLVTPIWSANRASDGSVSLGEDKVLVFRDGYLFAEVDR